MADFCLCAGLLKYYLRSKRFLRPLMNCEGPINSLLWVMWLHFHRSVRSVRTLHLSLRIQEEFPFR